MLSLHNTQGSRWHAILLCDVYPLLGVAFARLDLPTCLLAVQVSLNLPPPPSSGII